MGQIGAISLTKGFEAKHRRRKRRLEIEMTIDEILPLLPNRNGRENRILEFGCGPGDQIPYLQRIGDVVASDIYRDEKIQEYDVAFIQCSITDTPFGEDGFDLIHSNHVLEHIDDIDSSMRELMRIGGSECVYAFSVPTSLWLVLTIPGKYIKKAQSLFRRLRTTPELLGRQIGSNERESRVSGQMTWLDLIRKLVLPGGHGIYGSFAACYRAFKIKQWHNLFEAGDFQVIKTVPLLLYGPSKYPIVPTLRVSSERFCASILFLMKKGALPQEQEVAVSSGFSRPPLQDTSNYGSEAPLVGPRQASLS